MAMIMASPNYPIQMKGKGIICRKSSKNKIIQAKIKEVENKYATDHRLEIKSKYKATSGEYRKKIYTE